MRSLSAWFDLPLYQWLCNRLCNQDAYWTSFRLHAEQPCRTSCRKIMALRALPVRNVNLPIDGWTSTYNVERLHNILSRLWTVLRNIHSVTVCLPRNNHVFSTIIPFDWDVIMLSGCTIYWAVCGHYCAIFIQLPCVCRAITTSPAQ
jgi:hypothetical protein